MSLHELQQAFSAALLHGASADHLIAGPRGLGAADAAAIYRDALFANYRRALAASFPVVERLIGPDCFRQTADALVRAVPSTDGDVATFGAHLPDFLADHPPTRGLAWLPDVARLEWAIEMAAGAPDATPFDPAALAVDAPEALRLALHPSAWLLASHHPTLAIWRANQPDRDGTVDAAAAAGGACLLVVRRPDDVHVEALTPAEFAWLGALAAGQPLGDAVTAAFDTDPAFDLPATLTHHVRAGTLAGSSSAPERKLP